jgi:protein ImuB
MRQRNLLEKRRSPGPAAPCPRSDPATDAAALRKLALWGLRYSPIATAWDETSGGDGVFIDITGCAHLFGGEEACSTT